VKAMAEDRSREESLAAPDNHEVARRLRFKRVEMLFRQLLDIDSSARKPWLDAQCPDDPGIRRQVLAMAQADGLNDGVLDRPILGQAIDPSGFIAPRSPSAGHPARIGRFEIVGVLGHGGMGVVYEARQAEPCRAVALKAVQSGAAGRSLRRFRHEAQMLGRLQHPGIAQIFEAGVDDWGDGARPYFAMELVRGRDLITFANECRLNVRERLSLLARICDAVHHAHQHGVVHRDLKPANILVVDGAIDSTDRGTSHADDDAAQPKILDFGVARLLDSGATPATLQTSAGQIIGTIPYMSPEQAAGDPEAIDIRTDIYSLGVIAFELLANRHPHDLHGRPLHEAIRILREDEAPRLGTIDRRLRGDVETIVAKALEKDRRSRFASAAEMGADLRRVLRHEPIQARRLGVVDQVWKFSRRHRSLVSAAVVALLSLVAATAISIRAAIVATGAKVEQARLSSVATERADSAERSAYRATLVAAAAALRAHETAEAARLLAEVPTSRRGWEWAHMHSRLDDSLRAVAFTPPSPAHFVFNDEGSEILLVTADGVVERRRTDTFTLLQATVLPGSFREHAVTEVELTAGRDSTGRGTSVRILAQAAVIELDPASLDVVAHRSLSSLGPNSTAYAVDRTGHHVLRRDAKWQAGATVQLLRLADERVIFSGKAADGTGVAASFSPDGRYVAYCHGAADGLRVCLVEDGTVVLHRPDLQVVHRIRFDRTSSLLAAASASGNVHVLAIEDGVEVAELVGHTARTSALDFSADGTRIASASRDGTVRLWNLETKAAVAVMHGHDGAPSDLRFTPDGAHLFTICPEDSTLRVWSALEAHEPFVLPAPGSIYSIDLAADRTRLASASLGGDRPIRVWECEGFSQIGAFGDGSASAIAFDPTGDALAVGRAHGPIAILDAWDGHELSSAPGHWWRTDWVQFDVDSATLISLGNAGTISTHDARTGQPAREHRTGLTDSNFGWRAVRAPDGRVIAVTAPDGVHFLDPESLDEVARLPSDDVPVRAVSYAPDGSKLAVACADRRIRIWDLATRRVVATLEGHSAEVYAVAFSPDGGRLASGGADRLIRLWDMTQLDSSGRVDQLVQLRGHTSFIYCLLWHPDGHTLFSGGGDATLRIWSTRPFAEVVAARTGDTTSAASIKPPRP